MKKQIASGSNDARDESSQQKHHWSVTSAWRYALATIAALEKEQRLAKRRRTPGTDQRNFAFQL